MRFIGPIFSRYGALLIQFGLVTLVARELDVHSAGIYFFISGLVLSLYFFAGFGLPDGLVAMVPRNLEPESSGHALAVLKRARGFSLASVPLVAAVVGTVVWVVSGASTIAVFSGIWVLGYCLVFISSQNLMAMRKVRSGAFIFYSAINIALCLSTVPYLLLSESAQLEVTLALNAMASLIAGGASLVYAIRQEPLDSAVDSGTLVSGAWLEGAPIAAGRVLQGAIIWMPVWLAGLLLTESQTAQIGLASRLLGVVGAVLAAVRFSVRPQIAQLAAQERWPEIEALVRKIALWATVLALAALLGSALTAETLIPAFFGESYRASVVLLLVLLCAGVIESLGGPVDEVLKMTGRAKSVLAFQFVALVMMATLGTAFGRLWGPSGIAWAFVLSFLLLYGGQVLLVYKARGIIALPGLRGWA